MLSSYADPPQRRLPKWLEHALAVLGLCCVQDTPARWVGIHRRHHEHADEQPDPHSPLAGFLWAHIGWMIFRNRELTRSRLVSRYAKDVMRDPFYVKLEQDFRWVRVVLISWLGFFASALLVELVLGGSALDAIQFGFSVNLGSVRSHGPRLAHHLVRQFGHAYVGLSQLRHR